MSKMTVKFYGTRGSIPICDPNFQKFGGNTSCIAIHREDVDKLSVFDAGTGIRKLGKDVLTNYPDQHELFIAFSHFHWDHIQGLPFFGPAYDAKMKINILALGEGRRFTNLPGIFAMQMEQVYFPVPLNNMGCQFNFIVYENNGVQINNACIKAIKQNHPGDSYGYRIESAGKMIAICTDLEHGETINEDIVEFAKDADLLIHEAQYTNEELKNYRGWGHSSYEQAIEVAERANVKYLMMTHHDPDHDDEFLSKAERNCLDRFKYCAFAREGMEITI